MATKKRPLAAIKAATSAETTKQVDIDTTPKSKKAYKAPSRQDKKGVVVYVGEDLHHQLKMLALQNRSTLQSEFESMINQYLENHGIDPSQYLEIS